ncbi:MAG: Rpn family recombination-promoting nuclease/putative transposase [Planctomycetaceae bacterium]|jgi:predicted transposase YdaD|nr:Rpn family recombination-promoting nuclease/putative transposase [Planctomycetaceae bacterium]
MTINDQNVVSPEMQEFYPTWDKPIEEQFATTLVTHDIFFEMVFQLKKIACTFLFFLLPITLQNQLDIPNLKISVRRFRDENFKEARSDMIYEIPLKNNSQKYVKIYIIIEHKSYDESHTMSQLFNYETQIINAEIAIAKKKKIYNKNFKLSPIILVIFHHGQVVYTGSVELSDEFEKIEGTEEFILKQKGIIFDLSSMDKTELPHDPNVPELYASLRIMQVIMSKNLDEILCEEELLEELKPYTDNPECRKFARLFASYVFDSNHHLTQKGEQQFKQQLQKTFKGGKTMWSPLAKRYGAAGLKKGIKKGIKQGIKIGEAKGEARGEARGRIEGRIEGRVEGKVEGRAEGELEGRIEAIISILDVKFGEISETVRGSLCAITEVNLLQELVRFAAKCDTFEEFSKKLKLAKRKRH